MFRLPFYPKHEYGCPQVKHCPHLGGASLGTLVLAASDHSERFAQLHRQLDAERERCSELYAETVRLNEKVEQLKLELRLERQNKFATNQQQAETVTGNERVSKPAKKKGKLGAPVGHAAWYRETPTQYDVRIDVSANKRGHSAF